MLHHRYESDAGKLVCSRCQQLEREAAAAARPAGGRTTFKTNNPSMKLSCSQSAVAQAQSYSSALRAGRLPPVLPFNSLFFRRTHRRTEYSRHWAGLNLSKPYIKSQHPRCKYCSPCAPCLIPFWAIKTTDAQNSARLERDGNEGSVLRAPSSVGLTHVSTSLVGGDESGLGETVKCTSGTISSRSILSDLEAGENRRRDNIPNIPDKGDLSSKPPPVKIEEPGAHASHSRQEAKTADDNCAHDPWHLIETEDNGQAADRSSALQVGTGSIMHKATAEKDRRYANVGDANLLQTLDIECWVQSQDNIPESEDHSPQLVHVLQRSVSREHCPKYGGFFLDDQDRAPHDSEMDDVLSNGYSEELDDSWVTVDGEFDDFKSGRSPGSFDSARDAACGFLQRHILSRLRQSQDSSMRPSL